MPKNDKNVKKTYPKRKFKRRGPPPEVIEIYNKIILDTDGKYKFSNDVTSFDIKSAVINSYEYLSMIKLWTRFKPKSVEAVFKKQINLVDVMLPELLMRFSLFVTNNNPELPINPKACTHWSMLDNEVKRCYAPINPKFTDRDNCDWQQSNTSFACPIFCKISQALPGDIPTRPISLGIVKFKVSFIVERKDVENLVSNQKEMEQELAKKDKEIQQLKEILRLKEDTKKKMEEVGIQCDLDKENKKEEKEKEDEKEEQEGEEEEEEEGEVDDYEEYLDELRTLEYPEKMNEYKKRTGCKTDQEAWDKYDKYLKKRYNNPKPKEGKEYINPMPKEKKNKTFRQGMKKYEKKGLKFNPNLPKGKGCNGRLIGVENVGKRIEEKEDDDEENYYDPNYEPEYDYTNI